MAIAFFDPVTRHTAKRRNDRQAPEYCTHNAFPQPEPVHEAPQRWTNSSCRTARALADAVDRPENARMRTAVVDEDCSRRRSESFPNDLEKK